MNSKDTNHKPGKTSPSLQRLSTAAQLDPQSLIQGTRPLQNMAGTQICTDVKNENLMENMTTLLTYRSHLKKELTCAAQVDTRALMRSRCISMVSVSAICSARHNSRTTCNKWFHLRVNTTDRAAPGNVICLQQTHKIQGWEMKIFNNSFQMRHTVPHR